MSLHVKQEKAREARLEIGRERAVAPVGDEQELGARVRRERRAQTLGVGEGDLLVLAARDEEHRDGEPRGRLDGRGARDVVAEEEARPDARHPDERVLQEPEPCVELVAEQGQVGERRVRGGGADARVLGGGEQRDGAPEREAEDSRSEEHTSELQSQSNLVCRLLLEKKKKIKS